MGWPLNLSKMEYWLSSKSYQLYVIRYRTCILLSKKEGIVLVFLLHHLNVVYGPTLISTSSKKKKSRLYWSLFTLIMAGGPWQEPNSKGTRTWTQGQDTEAQDPDQRPKPKNNGLSPNGSLMIFGPVPYLGPHKQ